jgi:type I restriction enzyme, S subunit
VFAWPRFFLHIEELVRITETRIGNENQNWRAEMNHQPYPKYKESGVQWLGEVPEHWVVKRARFNILVNPSSPILRSLDGSIEISFLPMDAIGAYGGLRLDQIRIKADVGNGYTEFQNGDVVVAKITPCFENGKGALAENLVNSAAFGTTEIHVLRVLQYANNRFLFYLTICDGFRRLGESEMYGAGGQKRVPPEFIKDFSMPMPTIHEQIAIADFLDRETGRVDTLVAKNKKLIELLKEERSALISRTVTRGLPKDAAIEYGLEPHTRFKDSGVEWLGDVPEDWEVWKLAHLTKRIGSGKTPTGGAEVYQNEGVIFLRSQNVYDDGLYLDDVVYIDQKIDEEMAWSRVQGQDILLNITGASLGRTCIVPNELPKSNVNQHVCVIRLNNTDSAEYISLYLKSKPAKAFYDFVQTGSAREGLNFQQIGAFPIPLPLLPEQQTIAAFLDRETAKIDKLIEKVEALITRLQEYRIAIITDAVTGKIDVREMAA